MKQCICISCFDYYSTRMQAIINHFENKGYDTKYVYADFNHFSKAKNEHKYNKGVMIKVTQYKKNLSPQRLLSHIVFSNGVIRYIKKSKPEIIYCMIPPNSLVLKLAKYKEENKEVKLIFDCYDLWPESFPHRIDNKVIDGAFKIWGNLRKKYISKADLVIGVSEQQLDILRKELNGTDARILKPVIDTGKIPKYKSNIDSLDFCYLGMVNNIIDMDLIVEILGKLTKFKKVSIHIIGEGANLEIFTKRLEAASVMVVQHGVVFDMSKKNDIFSICNWGLNIPREEINSTMSLKAVEYLRAGLPILNNALGDIRRIVSQNNVGINISKDDTDKTIEAILNMSESDMEHLHDNVITTYKDCFEKQDYDEILKL